MSAQHPSRIGTGGIAIESSTSPRTARAEASTSPGTTYCSALPVLAPRDTRCVRCRRGDWVPLVHARSLPGGTVSRRCVRRRCRPRLIECRAAGPLDGLFFDIHGAMTVVGLTTPRRTWPARCIALRVGRHRTSLISTSMDLHGNVSRELAHTLRPDHLLPHGPARGRHGDQGARRPQPGRPACADGGAPTEGLGAGAGAAARREDPHPASNRPRASTPRSPRSRPPTASRRRHLGRLRLGRRAAQPRRRRRHRRRRRRAPAEAERLASRYLGRPRATSPSSPRPALCDACLDAALASEPTAPTSSATPATTRPPAAPATSPGRDSSCPGPRSSPTAAGRTVVYASVPDPDAVAHGVAAGVGATVTVTAGAEVDAAHAGPVTLTGARAADRSTATADAATEVVLRVGGVRRHPHRRAASPTTTSPTSPSSASTRADADMVIVKIGYLEPELFEHGRRLDAGPHPRRRRPGPLRLGPPAASSRPMFPFDTDMADPGPHRHRVPGNSGGSLGHGKT